MAYEIGLRPWEFQRMTPAQFARVVNGYERRQAREDDRAALICSHIYGPYIKKGGKLPAINKILGRKKSE